jgi:DNA-binding CsgD family transcriptional regulator
MHKPMHDQGQDLDLLKPGPHVQVRVGLGRCQQHGRGVSAIILIVQSIRPGGCSGAGAEVGPGCFEIGAPLRDVGRDRRVIGVDQRWVQAAGVVCCAAQERRGRCDEYQPGGAGLAGAGEIADGFLRPQALTLARRRVYIRILADEGAPMRAALAQLPAGRPGDQHAARRIGPGCLAEPLTGRELEVLRLLAAGKSNQRIARDLVVALDTVKSA